MRLLRRTVGPMLLALLAACAEAPPPSPPPAAPPAADHVSLLPVDFAALPGWNDDRVAEIVPALLKSCARLANLPPDRAIGAEGWGGTAADWIGPCGAARRLAPDDQDSARAYFRQWFQPFALVNNGSAEGLFTGYYEPELAGSRQRQGRFTIPLLARPKDLVIADLGQLRPDLGREQLAGRVVDGRLEPYPSRAEIESGGLGALAQPLVWLDDAVDAHILHIQGSGRVRFPDGTVQRVGVAASNGRKFVGLGKLLADAGKVEAGASMPEIRAWLKAHPAEAARLMAANPRYIFYRLVEGDGPIGAQGVALTPGRSLAIDNRFVPLGVPVWLDTTEPSGRPLRRLVMAQDTGAAIKGPVRGDLFWGAGEAAFEQAGRMKSRGRTWLLLPIQRSPAVATAR